MLYCQLETLVCSVGVYIEDIQPGGNVAHVNHVGHGCCCYGLHTSALQAVQAYARLYAFEREVNMQLLACRVGIYGGLGLLQLALYA